MIWVQIQVLWLYSAATPRWAWKEAAIQPQPAPELSPYVIKPALSPWLAMGGIAFCGLFCAFMLDSFARVIVPLVAIGLIVVLLIKCGQEQQRIARQKIATGIVQTWKMESDSENGKTYIVTYRFTAADGQSYEGKGTSSRQLAREGEAIAISYEPGKPSDNMPLASYWFFTFLEPRN